MTNQSWVHAPSVSVPPSAMAVDDSWPMIRARAQFARRYMAVSWRHLSGEHLTILWCDDVLWHGGVSGRLFETDYLEVEKIVDRVRSVPYRKLLTRSVACIER